MKQEEIMTKILNCSIPTYYKRKRENNSSILILERYFTKNELKEFVETGEIKKLELIKDKSVDELDRLFKKEHNKAIMDEIEGLKQKQAELESKLV